MVVRRLGYTRWEIGLNLNKLPYQFLIMLTGVPFGIAEYYILKPSPLVDSSTWEGMLLPALILIVCTGFVEELCFRGVMQLSAGEALGQWGWIYIAVLFAAMHIGYLSIWDGIFVLAVGLFFGLMVNKTRSIIGVTLSHGITNVILYLVAPFYF
ncbi:MAG: lysostaphin resistance A-like protein [Promethearchaeota archaeon]